ncbi:frizzled-1-like [Cloeon dipterum]|uniref:frizzled-1-like n=1 Tax=Cloeon dipterum TaxID=197152 RepID=UPI00321FD75C
MKILGFFLWTSWFCISVSLALHPKCEPIRIPFCTELPYNKTIMPNLVNHQIQEDAGLEVHIYFPLVKVNCSPDMKLFLCSVYTPKCNNLGVPLPPCKDLCLSAKNGCGPLMQRFGFAWPDVLNCDKFPNPGDGVLCYAKPTSV